MYSIDPGAILDAIATPAFTVDVRGGDPVYADVNAAYTEICGITPSAARGRTARELFGEQAGATAMRRQYRVARTRLAERFTMMHPCHDGERTFRMSLHPVPRVDRPDDMPLVIGTMIEVETTAQAQNPETVLMAAEEVRQFITIAAHDLRSPMRQVSTIALLLSEAERRDDPDSFELIGMLSELGEKAQEMISEVLDYARMVDLPKIDACFDFGALCGDIFSVLDPPRFHDLRCWTGRLFADRTALQIIVRNLVDNALKHAGTRRIVLDIALRPAPAEMIEIMVRDNGKGFPDPSIAFLSGEEFRYGTGLGLLGLKRLVTSRAGLIWAERPESGIGAEIRCLLPGRILDCLDAQV